MHDFIRDPDMASEVFTYLGMDGFNVPALMGELQSRPNDAILAGGCVANTLLNILEGSPKYPVNDLDLFILDEAPSNKLALESFQSKPATTDEYWQLASPKLYMVGRDEGEEIDKVFMSLDHRLPSEIIDFPRYVLNSFDLNCVEVGIYSDGKSFKFIWNDTFEKFLETRKVEITNVHSEVTFLRAIKKSRDLNATINHKEEFEIVWYSCNSRYLNELTSEQKTKHQHLFTNFWIRERLAILRYSQPLHDEVYQSFFDTKLMGNRRDKIKILRYFRDENMKNFLCLPYIFQYEHVMYLSSLYDGDLETFFGRKQHRSNMARTLDGQIRDTGVSWMFVGKTLSQSCGIIEDLLHITDEMDEAEEKLFYEQLDSLSRIERDKIDDYGTVKEVIDNRDSPVVKYSVEIKEDIPF